MKLVFSLITILMLGLGISGQTSATKDIEATTPDGKIVVLKPDGTWSFKAIDKGKKLGVTAAAFAVIQEGMSYAECVAILGKEGVVQSDNTTYGVRTAGFEWTGDKGIGHLTLIFQKDELFSKMQVGLK